MQVSVPGEVPNNPPLHLMEGTCYFPVSSHPNVVQNVILDRELMASSKPGPKENQLREKEGCFGPVLRVFDVMTHPRLDANSVMICDVRDSDKRLLCLKYVLFSFLSEIPSVRLIVVVGGTDEQIPSLPSTTGLEVVTYSKLFSEGRSSPQPFYPPKPDDVATICYTSGTTGTPKSIIAVGIAWFSAFGPCQELYYNSNPFGAAGKIGPGQLC
ncbi:long-chain-fatty-acid--CoA ligase, partial [Sarracenia purpurea var. burkii]